MSENAPFLVASATASAMAREPAVKLSNSNTPAGPFHRIVLAPLMASAKSFWVAGLRLSLPNLQEMLLAGTTCVCASLAKSVGSHAVRTQYEVYAFGLRLFDDIESQLQFVVFADGVTDLAALGFGKSISHTAAQNRVVHLVHQVFDDTDFGRNLEPPMMAVNGRLMLLNTLSTAFTSFSIR